MKVWLQLRSSFSWLASWRTIARIVGASLLFIFTDIQTVRAQQSTAPTDNDHDTIQLLLKRVEELETQVKELKAARTATVSSLAAPPPSPVKVEPEDSHAQTHTEHAIPKQADKPGLQIHGFADVGFHTSGEKGSTNSFTVGQLDLFLTSRLSDKVNVLGEIVFEAGHYNGIEVDVERLMLQLTPSDYFNVGIGRYHTAIGYYNTAYHHGTWFQTAVNRPFIFEFEDDGGILPIHNVGLTVDGRVPSGALGLHYIAEIGNGRTSRSSMAEAVQISMDENNSKAFNLVLLARPDRVPGLQTGFSIYRDRLAPNGLPRIGQTIMAAHMIYQGHEVEFLNEALVVRHSPHGTRQTFNTPGFYSQIARRFGPIRPYFRYQYVNASDREPIFSDVGLRHGPSIGLRYDFSEFVAFKAQYDRTARRRLSAINELTLQFAFTF
jgi:hypothetical protein